MPRSTTRVPRLRRHKASGQGFIEVQGRRKYLGVWGRPETEGRYRQIVAEWAANGGALLPPQKEGITVTELIAHFWSHAKSHYKGSPELDNFRCALKPVIELYGRIPAAGFSPRALKAVRHRMIGSGNSRKYINACVRRIKRVFRWAVSEELLSPEVLHKLEAIEGLRRGRSAARETDPVRPVPSAHIAAIEPFVSREIWAVIRLQLLTGARGGEILHMRLSELDVSEDVWVYRPRQHKNTFRGHIGVGA